MGMRRGMLVVLAMVSLFLLTSCSAGRYIANRLNPEDALKNLRGKGGKEEKKEVKKDKKEKKEKPIEIAHETD